MFLGVSDVCGNIYLGKGIQIIWQNSCISRHSTYFQRNGRGRYVIIDIAEYQKQEATIKLLSKLAVADKAIKTGEEWLTTEDVKAALEL